MDERPITTAAKEAASFFETARRATGDTATGPREDGEEYVRLKDGAPEWVKELVHDAHKDGSEWGMLPDDTRYEMIREAVQWIADSDDDRLEDLMSAFADEGSVYTGEQIAWLASRLDRYSYVDAWVEEYDYQGSDDRQSGGGGRPSVMEMIRGGMTQERAEVYDLVLQGLADLPSALDEHDDADGDRLATGEQA